ncbi:uncharacterized protein LOC142985318 isoform X2 [Anticarsia gemmatalis]|uniref:uncharacterized protein LOC142985318 isoform X2 n=1 Tax=Anticarsia gemmatalis TaxID=129554 RepID=UPI003F758EB7
MRLICFWCFLMAAAVRAQNDGYYAPQTFRQVPEKPITSLKEVKPLSELKSQPKDLKIDNQKQAKSRQLTFRRNACACYDVLRGLIVCPVCKRHTDTSTALTAKVIVTTGATRVRSIKGDSYRPLFAPARNDVTPQGTTVGQPWRGPAPVSEPWREPNSGSTSGSIIPKSEPWRLPYGLSKEQQAAILHHKQSLTSDGAFRFEYASDNGLAAGEQIEPDGSRVGAYQYKDPSGQIVKLKYRAGKEGFQILEGSHLPKSPEPVPPVNTDNYYNQAYQQQREQYNLQQQYNQQKPEPQQNWAQNQGNEGAQRGAGNQYFVSNWKPSVGASDDGQYHDNEVDPNKPHSFGEGFAFAFKG